MTVFTTTIRGGVPPMPRGKQVTPEMVSDVRKAKTRWPDMSNEEIGRYAGTSAATVGRILSGAYDRIASAVPSDGGAVVELLESIDAKLSRMEDVADRLLDIQNSQATATDLAHIIGLMLARLLAADNERGQWEAVLTAADEGFSIKSDD